MLDSEYVETAVSWTERGTWWACRLQSLQLTSSITAVHSLAALWRLSKI